MPLPELQQVLQEVQRVKAARKRAWDQERARMRSRHRSR